MRESFHLHNITMISEQFPPVREPVPPPRPNPGSTLGSTKDGSSSTNVF